ncbi:MAG: hypothetical protein JNK35_07170 [Phycisphaerae bacterium]|nr:hypothetical protein [Phycisphaerae bacterium]
MHDVQVTISLELSRLVAAEILRNPELVSVARDNIARWRARNAGAPTLLRCYDEWAGILERPVEEIAAILVAETEEGQRLRQNSPFPGVLDNQTVWAVKRRVRDDQAAT